ATTTKIESAQGTPHFRLHNWHEYHLICKGNEITLNVDGKLVAQVIDNDPDQQDFTGILALQLHSGPPMTVQFKDILLKKL
ncbi:MAG: family 16 glycoside hydrolase, partial [Candidatus Hydrogenedentota bacterium]